MHFSQFFHASLLSGALQGALALGHGQSTPPSAPFHSAFPKAPSKFKLPSAGVRSEKVCTIDAHLADAGPAILAAAHKCNNGGTVYFPAGVNYTISTALDLTFLKNIDFAILGTIYFNDTVDIWPSQTFNYPFQSASMFWRFGGTNVRIYGLGQGTIDGLGQAYWSAMKVNASVERPILFGTDGLRQSSISGLNMRNPPNWFNFYTNSSDLLITDMKLTVVSTNSSAPAKNTDGFDTYRSSNIVIQNSVVVNTDDCVSFKPNSTSVVVQNLRCTGSHGISVGSLGQYQGEIDIVQDIYVYNTSMTNATDGARIKAWPGAAPGSGSTSGGGSGWVKNVTYELLDSTNNDEVIALTQCYGVSNQTQCETYPSSLVIEDVLFKDFYGTTSKKYDPSGGSLVCSGPSVCSNIRAQNISVTVPSKKATRYTCVNVDTSLLELTCVA